MLHQPVCIEHDPADLSMTEPMVDKPFFHWLVRHEDTPSIFHNALVEYLVGPGFSTCMLWGEFASLTEDNFIAYKYTFQHYWYARLKWDAKTRKSNLHEWMLPLIPRRPKPIGHDLGTSYN